MPHRTHLEQFGPIYALPILHYRMEFAHLVWEAVNGLQPDCICIELPPSLKQPLLRAVQRLPQISILSYETKPGKNREAQTVYLVIEPADPLVEAVRLAVEQEIPLQLIDVDLDDYPLHQEPLPDSYAIHRLGLKSYYEAFKKSGDAPPGRDDLLRERGMAYQLQQLARVHGRILFVCGMYHLERVAQFYEQPQAAPLSRLHRGDIRIHNLHPDSCREILGEYPFLSALYELRRGPLPPVPETVNQTLRKRFSALELIDGGKTHIAEEEVLRQAVMGSAHQVGGVGEMPDRQRIMLRLFQEAARHYRQETGEPVHIWQKRAFFRFARNYALLSGNLLPDLFQMLTAARSCIDDNFAYALYRLATFPIFQKDQSDVPNIRLSPEDLWSGNRRIRFRPREQHRGKGLSPLAFLKRKKEKHPGEWLDGFDNHSICSYPPEDLVIEDYGRFLKQKGAKQLSEEQCRVEPFSASMLDGIDMRETLRNLHEGRIYVRENQRVKGGVGSVVVIFDEDRSNKGFPYRMTWLGEHAQESDMAFYATSPDENVVGPGICRCEYGGFILSYPPRRMLDVWSDGDYAFARSKAEVLLLAALDYSPEKHVVHVAARPPRSYFRQIAARLGKKIVHIPLGSLSPVKLKRLRIFHVLYGHDKREIAGDYIW